MASYGEALAAKCEEFCVGNYGYDQGNRWGEDECDCSSLVYRCIYAIDPNTRLTRKDPRYIGTLYRDLTAIGFTVVPLSQRKRGDVLLNTKHHVLIYLGNGKVGGARIDERGKASGGKGGDQTGQEVCVHNYYNYPWDYCLRPPQVEIGDDIVTDQDIQRIALAVWNYKNEKVNGGNDCYKLLTEAPFRVWNYHNDDTNPGVDAYGLLTEAYKQSATITAMSAALEQLSKSVGADPDEIAKAVSDAVAKKLESINLSVTVDDKE